MDGGSARIIMTGEGARSVVASAARISTTEGDALGIYARAGDAEKDVKLIKKVLSSGHKSVMEHHAFSIAFNNVSVLAEQFMIEHRLASYTVKSRRYVDHAGAGYVVPRSLSGAAADKYVNAMDGLFALYADMESAGIPKEDARFVLPYSFRSNFYMTLNGRELMRLISEMTAGRGAAVPELCELGGQLRAQFDEIYPGVLNSQGGLPVYKAAEARICAGMGGEVSGNAEMLPGAGDSAMLLSRAMAFSGRFLPEDGEYITEKNMLALVRDARPRELEYMNAGFHIENVSLACVTHFTRHRMLSIIVPDVASALTKGDYIVPATLKADAALLARYKAAFRAEAELARELIDSGIDPEEAGYLALAGNVIDIMLNMNGRELLHFLKLRTCNRAQWEIRRLARQMLDVLRENCDDIYWVYGPSCQVDGKCPEGKLSCGHPVAR